MTVIVKVCGALVSTPPLAVPPLSWMRTVTIALPEALAAGVYVSAPAGLIAGWALNRPLLSLLTRKSTTWPASFDGPALIAVAQPAILAAPESSATVWLPPLVNDGASFTADTVIVKVWVALVSIPPLLVPPSSWIETVTIADPDRFAAGVKVRTPAALTAGWALNSALLSLVTVKPTVWPDSFDGPLLMAVAQPLTVAAPESSNTVWSAPLVNDGASLTGWMVIVKVVFALASLPPLAVPPSSWIRIVTVDEPNALAAGVKVS